MSHESLPMPDPQPVDDAPQPGEAESDVTVVPSDKETIVSDEGILYMDSSEADILDSDDQIFLSNSERIAREDQPPE